MSKARDLAGLFNLGSRSGTTAQRPATADVGDIYYNGTTGKTEIYTTTGWKEMASGIPFGNTAGRPTAVTGQPYFNGETARLEMYTATGWQNIVQEVPGVASITGTYSEATNSGTITIAGTNFVSGAIASAIGTNGVEILASSTTYNSLVQISAIFTGLSNANEPYDIKVTNPSNLFGLIPDALYVNASPVWATTAGTLGTFVEEVSVSLSATATDSDSTITYALASGSTLPAGVSLNASTGAITGTLPNIATDTTYSFIVNASDGLNTIPRTFSITSTAKLDLEFLLVGGGGGGGSQVGGGGGAGGLVYSASYNVLKGSQALVTIGGGGVGGPYFGQGASRPGNSGSNTTFGSFVAIGGGGGGGHGGNPPASGADGLLTQSGRPGGSGGGGGANSSNGSAGSSTQSSPSGATGYGFDGGTGFVSNWAGGGGGGAGSAGANAIANNGGAGGAGKQYSITGTALYYAGGGGGCSEATGNVAAAGGSGVGGNGFGNNANADNTQVTGNGAINTGSGGGGARDTGPGGSGGSGVVVIAYPDTFPALTTIPGTLTYNQPTRSGYRVYRFTAGSGTVTF